MGLLYLDASREYTDPANTDLKYLRADGQWAAPDSDHRFLDATGEWSVPELIPPMPADLSTPESLLAASANAKVNPTAVYEALREELTPAISFGSTYCSHQFRLVGVSKENATAGGKAGLVLLSEDCTGMTSAQRSSGGNRGGYADSETMLEYLRGLCDAMDPEWSAIITPVDIPYSTSLTEISTLANQKLFLPSMWNVGMYDANYCEKEGECWDYFVGAALTSDCEKRNRVGGPTGRWWLRSGHYYGDSYFANVDMGGTLRGNRGSTMQLGVVPAFCV